MSRPTIAIALAMLAATASAAPAKPAADPYPSTYQRIPSATVKVTDAGQAKSVLGLVEALEDNEDVQNVYANFDIPDEILQSVVN